MNFSVAEGRLSIAFPTEELGPGKTLFVAMRTGREPGSAVVPFAENFEGSTVFLPFQADRLYFVQIGQERSRLFERHWERWKWSDRRDPPNEVEWDEARSLLRLPVTDPDHRLALAIYVKDFRDGKTWGRLTACQDPAVTPGEGDKYFPHYCELDLRAKAAPAMRLRRRHGQEEERPRVYQLFVRLFGNTNEIRRPNGTLAVNGVGKFDDINNAALGSLRALGFSHVWLTGVLQQATGTDHSDIGQAADDPDLLKGIAGSPYAIKDYFDVCPDYAVEPKERLMEFKALLDRLHAHQLKALIDFIPNHVARCYHSDIKPEINFGTHDDRSQFFAPTNNFFYLQPSAEGPPLKLPTWENGVALSPTCRLDGMTCDGRFAGELEHGKVTGNNVASWSPDINDWYETVKLNYGFDFTDSAKSRRAYPSAWQPDALIPDTWTKMNQVIAYWQAMGVDGFRCDMAHMEPPEFWKWLIGRARTRSPQVFFIGEAYDGDPAKVPGSDPIISRLNGGKSNVMFDLLDAGFDAVYDDPTYKTLKNIYDGSGWANDLDQARTDDFIFENSVRYAENHDEVRLAGRGNWGGVGMNVGRAVAPIIYGIGRGVIMLYNGQEVGEPAEGAEGFGGDDARTSIFDYWSMPELAKWTNEHRYDGGKLSLEQKSLREIYRRLLGLTNEPAFHDGGFFGLNPANNQNPSFGQAGVEPASGHWLYAFLRFDRTSGQRFLVVVNLHPKEEMKTIHVRFPEAAIAFLHFSPNEKKLKLEEKLSGRKRFSVDISTLAEREGLALPPLAPLTACFFEITPTEN
ncbi:MAG TPA: alpha-amylase family glycosyl hydrolase [Chthoniobacterales bacterium]